jgi:hypothetical protein
MLLSGTIEAFVSILEKPAAAPQNFLVDLI